MLRMRLCVRGTRAQFRACEMIMNPRHTDAGRMMTTMTTTAFTIRTALRSRIVCRAYSTNNVHRCRTAARDQQFQEHADKTHTHTRTINAASIAAKVQFRTFRNPPLACALVGLLLTYAYSFGVFCVQILVCVCVCDATDAGQRRKAEKTPSSPPPTTTTTHCVRVEQHTHIDLRHVKCMRVHITVHIALFGAVWLKISRVGTREQCYDYYISTYTNTHSHRYSLQCTPNMQPKLAAAMFAVES